MSFTKIFSGETQVFKIAENELFLAFLEPEPIVLGHTVVLPKESGGYIFEMEQESFLALHLFAKQVAIKRSVHWRPIKAIKTKVSENEFQGLAIKKAIT